MGPKPPKKHIGQEKLTSSHQSQGSPVNLVSPETLKPQGKKSRITPFQHKHALEYGHKQVSSVNGQESVVCLFCFHEGRDKVEVGPDSTRKRKSCTTIQYFSKPFTTDKYKSHLSQHKESWAKYSALSHSGKREYFDKYTKDTLPLEHHFSLTSDTISYIVPAPIVDIIIGELSFGRMRMGTTLIPRTRTRR